MIDQVQKMIEGQLGSHLIKDALKKLEADGRVAEFAASVVKEILEFATSNPDCDEAYGWLKPTIEGVGVHIQATPPNLAEVPAYVSSVMVWHLLR